MTQIIQMSTDKSLHQELTEQIISCFYKVYNTLGSGFLERVYQNAMYLELLSNGFACETQKKIYVYYNDKIVGEYFADIIVNDLIILELKAAESLAREHELQLINYLKSSDIEVGLLLNFGKTPQIKRKIFNNIKQS